jgi:hypothetical protein
MGDCVLSHEAAHKSARHNARVNEPSIWAVESESEGRYTIRRVGEFPATIGAEVVAIYRSASGVLQAFVPHHALIPNMPTSTTRIVSTENSVLVEWSPYQAKPTSVDEAARTLRTIGSFLGNFKTPPEFYVEHDGRIITDNKIEVVYCRNAEDARAALKGAGFKQLAKSAWWAAP